MMKLQLMVSRMTIVASKMSQLQSMGQKPQAPPLWQDGHKSTSSTPSFMLSSCPLLAAHCSVSLYQHSQVLRSAASTAPSAPLLRLSSWLESEGSTRRANRVLRATPSAMHWLRKLSKTMEILWKLSLSPSAPCTSLLSAASPSRCRWHSMEMLRTLRKRLDYSRGCSTEDDWLDWIAAAFISLKQIAHLYIHPSTRILSKNMTPLHHIYK